jgi:outer membrane protein assembly factor BamB
MLSMIKNVAALLVTLSSTAWAQVGDLVAEPALTSLGYYSFWRTQTQVDAQVQALERVDENLYLLTKDCCVTAVHADAGTVRWSARVGAAGQRVFAPSHVRSFWGRDLTLLTSSAGLQWRDRVTGELVASITPEFIPCAGAVSDGMRVFVPGLDEMFYCLELVPGRSDFRVIQRWRVQTGGLTRSPAVLWGDGLYFVSDDGRVRACTARDKGRLWVFATDRPVQARPHIDATGVYFGGLDHRIYKLDPLTGRYAWPYKRVQVPEAVTLSPVLLGERLFQVVEGRGIYVIDTNSGDTLWTLNEAAAFISATPQRVHLLSNQGEILVVDPSNGHIVQRYWTAGARFAVANTSTSAMYLADSSGLVQCAAEKFVPYLRFEAAEASLAR